MLPERSLSYELKAFCIKEMKQVNIIKSILIIQQVFIAATSLDEIPRSNIKTFRLTMYGVINIDLECIFVVVME